MFLEIINADQTYASSLAVLELAGNSLLAYHSLEISLLWHNDQLKLFRLWPSYEPISRAKACSLH